MFDFQNLIVLVVVALIANYVPFTNIPDLIGTIFSILGIFFSYVQLHVLNLFSQSTHVMK
jgi:hypothetical protein